MMEHLSLVPYEGGGGGGGGEKYKECMRNHAAAMGGQAFDGCGEFMPDSPDSLKCAACGCHRSFHRRAAASSPVFFRPPLLTPSPTPQPHHHHVPALQAFLPPTAPAPHLALPYHAVPPGAAAAVPWSVLRAGSETPPRPEDFMGGLGSGGSGSGSGAGMARKRFRTKFTPEQKERMREFAEQQGWRINRNDDGALERFCLEIGVRRQVLKVWMHNHKNHGQKQGHQQHTATPSPFQAHAAGGADATVGSGGTVKFNPSIGTTTGPNIPGLGGGGRVGVGDDDDDDDDTDDSPPRAAVSSPSPSPISV